MSDLPMMKCGCAANATRDGNPCCVIHAPQPEAYEIDEAPPSFEGREAKCSYCSSKIKSPGGAFFMSQPNKEYDSFYCGCRGWD